MVASRDMAARLPWSWSLSTNWAAEVALWQEAGRLFAQCAAWAAQLRLSPGETLGHSQATQPLARCWPWQAPQPFAATVGQEQGSEARAGESHWP